MKKLITLTTCLLLSFTSSKAAVILLDVFEGIDTTGISLSVELIQTQNSELKLLVINDSTIQSVITQIAFEDLSSILSQPTIPSQWDIDNSANIPGSNNISFNTDYGLKSKPSPIQNGIASGEQIEIILPNVNKSDVLYGFENGTIKMAVHVQSIGSNSTSASYTSLIPEPTSTMLSALGMGLILFRRTK
jgi:hypothetical protein